LDTTGVRDGYCVAWGAGSGRLVTELIQQSNLHVLVVERDPRKLDRLRDRLVAADLHGTRASVHLGGPLTFPLPPYLAALAVSEDLDASRIELYGAFRN